MKKGLKRVLFTTMLLGAATQTAAFDWRDLFREHNTAYAVKRAPRPYAAPHYSTLEASELVALRQMLKDGDYDRLNARLAVWQAAFENDPTDEYAVRDAYTAFAAMEPLSEYLMQTWRDARPESYQPYLALAHHYHAKGWASRGTKWAQRTTNAQFDAMHAAFDKARDNIRTARKIHPGLVAAALLRIDIAKTASEPRKYAIMKAAARRFPHSFLIADAILSAQTPRWGGSYARMERYADYFRKFTRANPRMATLYGHIYADQGQSAMIQQQMEPSRLFYLKAKHYGAYWIYDYQLALIDYIAHNYGMAMTRVDAAIALSPLQSASHLLRSKIAHELQGYDEAIRSYKTAMMIMPEQPEIIEWKGWVTGNLIAKGYEVTATDPARAIEYLNLALQYDADSASAYYYRVNAWIRQEQFEAALADAKRAISLDPRHFESYRMIDYLYARKHQWEPIIRSWNAYIKLEPTHADAYFERSGTHYHNGDMKNALRDLKKACELGSKKACAQHARVAR